MRNDLVRRNSRPTSRTKIKSIRDTRRRLVKASSFSTVSPTQVGGRKASERIGTHVEGRCFDVDADKLDLLSLIVCLRHCCLNDVVHTFRSTHARSTPIRNMEEINKLSDAQGNDALTRAYIKIC